MSPNGINHRSYNFGVSPQPDAVPKVENMPLAINHRANPLNFRGNHIFPSKQGHRIQIALHHHIPGKISQFKFRLDTNGIGARNCSSSALRHAHPTRKHDHR